MKICLVLAVVVSTNALQHSAMWSLNDADQGGGWATLTFDVANTTQIDTNYKNGIRKMRGGVLAVNRMDVHTFIQLVLRAASTAQMHACGHARVRVQCHLALKATYLLAFANTASQMF